MFCIISKKIIIFFQHVEIIFNAYPNECPQKMYLKNTNQAFENVKMGIECNVDHIYKNVSCFKKC